MKSTRKKKTGQRAPRPKAYRRMVAKADQERSHLSFVQVGSHLVPKSQFDLDALADVSRDGAKKTEQVDAYHEFLFMADPSLRLFRMDVSLLQSLMQEMRPAAKPIRSRIDPRLVLKDGSRLTARIQPVPLKPSVEPTKPRSSVFGEGRRVDCVQTRLNGTPWSDVPMGEEVTLYPEGERRQSPVNVRVKGRVISKGDVANHAPSVTLTDDRVRAIASQIASRINGEVYGRASRRSKNPLKNPRRCPILICRHNEGTRSHLHILIWLPREYDVTAVEELVKTVIRPLDFVHRKFVVREETCLRTSIDYNIDDAKSRTQDAVIYVYVPPVDAGSTVEGSISQSNPSRGKGIPESDLTGAAGLTFPTFDALA